MSEVEKLRALLAEARAAMIDGVGTAYDMEAIDTAFSVAERIAAALAEPVKEESLYGIREDRDSLRVEIKRLERERDEARAEVERLRNALAAISLDEYESTSSASEKVHGHARIARKALYGDAP